MVHPLVMLFPATAIAISVFSPTTVDGTPDLVSAMSRLQNAARPRHCGHLREAGQTRSGVYTIYPYAASESGQLVYCYMYGLPDNDYWTVILFRTQHENSIFYFYKNWTEYASGFGDPMKEDYVGNRAIHALTSGEEQMTLRVVLSNGTTVNTIEYGRFKISSEEDSFTISVGDYKGPKGWDALTAANGRPFQTFDRAVNDNREHVNCASTRRGAWWYTSNCEGANLNGVNFYGKHMYPGSGIQWLNHSLEGVDWSRYSYAVARMMIKPAGAPKYGRRR